MSYVLAMFIGVNSQKGRDIYLFRFIAVSRPVVTKADFNLNIIATLPLISNSSPGKNIRRHRRSELCGLDVTISARYDWPDASLFHYVIGISGILPYNRNVTLQTFLSITRDFFRLHNTLARLYNAAASPASRLRSAGSLKMNVCLEPRFCARNLTT